MEIPVLWTFRTVGTHVESVSRERKDRSKRGRRHTGKSVCQSEDVIDTEHKVGKHVSHVPRKAAIVVFIPVP